MILKKIAWAIKRHPYLYLMRFRLLSKNISKEDIASRYYNLMNDASDIPENYFAVNKKIFPNSAQDQTLNTVLVLSSWLQKNIKGGPGLSEPSDAALNIMLEGKGGVCSDMAQIFNNFCVINSIKVREWGATRIPFDKDYGGHSFNEVYCEDLKKWVLIDVSYCILFYDSNEIPLSVLEFQECISLGREVVYKSFAKIEDKLIHRIDKNYFHKDNVSFLIDNYSNLDYDRNLKRYKSVFPIFLIHFILYLRNKSYNYLFPFKDYRLLFV